MTSPADQTSVSPLPKLLYDLFHDAESLLFQQFALFRAEMSEAVGQLLRGSAVMLLGLEIAVAGLVMLASAVIIAVAHVVPLWLACVMVGVASLGVALVLVAAGRRRIAAAGFAPRRAVRALRETRNWFEDEFT